MNIMYAYARNISVTTLSKFCHKPHYLMIVVKNYGRIQLKKKKNQRHGLASLPWNIISKLLQSVKAKDG